MNEQNLLALPCNITPEQQQQQLLADLRDRRQNNRILTLLNDTPKHSFLAAKIFKHMISKIDQWHSTIEILLYIERNRDGPLELYILHGAARYGYCQYIQDTFLTRARINLTNSRGNTPLHVAVEYGNSKDVSVLIRHNAQFIANNDGWTPLHFAAASADPQLIIVRDLIGHIGRNPEFRRLLNAQIHS